MALPDPLPHDPDHQHLIYTSDGLEVAILEKAGWTRVGRVGYVYYLDGTEGAYPPRTAAPIIRLAHPKGWWRYYTTSLTHEDEMVKHGWTSEGTIGWLDLDAAPRTVVEEGTSGGIKWTKTSVYVPVYDPLMLLGAHMPAWGYSGWDPSTALPFWDEPHIRVTVAKGLDSVYLPVFFKAAAGFVPHMPPDAYKTRELWAYISPAPPAPPEGSWFSRWWHGLTGGEKDLFNLGLFVLAIGGPIAAGLLFGGTGRKNGSSDENDRFVNEPPDPSKAG